MLVLKPVLSATSMAPGFAWFKQAKLNHLLGKVQPTVQQGQAGTAQQNAQINQMQSFVTTLGNTVQQMGTTMQQVVQQGANQVMALQQGQILQCRQMDTLRSTINDIICSYSPAIVGRKQ